MREREDEGRRIRILHPNQHTMSRSSLSNCSACGFTGDFCWSRIEPMGYVCPKCGKHDTAMKTELTKSKYIEDWYVVKPSAGGVPEGTSEEWREILAAMKERQRQGFNRVAVKFDKDGTAWLWSPRNSRKETSVHIAPRDVDGWIAAAESILI